MFQPDLLKGKRTLVTGGGTGLGRSMSHRFLDLGANVVIYGRRGDVLERTAEELTNETGAEIETVRCDVRMPDAVEAMMDRIWQKRPLDILVNNAAGLSFARTSSDSLGAPSGSGVRAVSWA
jgi:NAD(P)-dependent dehydrogenase (short-subunit alcohol dehydrogenase family)